MMHVTTPVELAEDFLLYDLELLDAPPERAFDNLTKLAQRMLHAENSTLTIAHSSMDRLFFKSHYGTDKTMIEVRDLPLSQSLCLHVKNANRPIIVNDTRAHPLLKHSRSVTGHNIVGFLAMPIHLPDGTPIGALACYDSAPRDWSADDIETLSQLAMCVDEQIAQKNALRATEAAETRAREAAKARESFLAHMSHEIRTPLNGIIGGADLLMKMKDNTQMADLHGPCLPGPLEPKTRRNRHHELLATIEKSAQNLLRLVNDALDLSKIDAGMMALEEESFDLLQCVREVCDLNQPNAAAKRLDLRLNPIDLPAGETRWGDAFRLRQILGNLLTNAIKFTDRGLVCVDLSCSEQGVMLSVRDQGCGIEPDQIDKLFEPYTQAEASVARRKGGTGLGLAIVKNIVDLMGGNISVSSQPGQGTIFDVSLPLPRVARHSQNSATSPTAPPPPLPRSIAGARILVADDSPANRMILTRMLEGMGADVVSAKCGDEALMLASDGAFDILFLDIQMPGKTGIEVVQALGASDFASEGLKEAYKVAVTANIFPEQVKSYLAAGFDCHLGKPLRSEDILGLLQPDVAKSQQAAPTVA